MNDIDISYTKPDEEIAPPSEEYVMLNLPFVGIYESILDANIESSIEREVEWREENGEEPYKKAVVDLKAIYKSIAEFTAEKLGFETAVYAGANSPSYYNYRDDYIFVWVKKSEVEELYEKHKLNKKADIDKLYIALAAASDDLKVEESDNMNYSIAIAVYDEWYDSAEHCGYEVIDNNIEYS